MAFVPGCDHDVFISYSHHNNHAGWVTRFRTKLTERLKEFLGEEPDVFLDLSHVHGNDDLDARIDQGIRRSAVLVPVVSHSYVKREWCRLECREFRDANPEQGVRTRIFPVRYDDVSPAEFQLHVGREIGYVFFGKDEAARYADTWLDDSEDFRRQMNTLRIEIGQRLQELKEEVAAPASRLPLDGSRPTVLLAESTSHLQRFHDNLAGFLRGYQIEVIHPGERFYVLDDYEAAFGRQLAGADLFVQLLGRFFSPHDDEAICSWEQWQSRKAVAAGKPALRWFHKYDKEHRPIDMATLDAAHRAFVQSAGVWDNDFELFKQLVLSEVQRHHQTRLQRKRVEQADAVRPMIVLRSDKSDSAFAEQIGETLTQQRCEWVRIPDKEITSLEEFCREYAADGLLVVYRSCPGRWVLSRLQELRKFLRTETARRWACGLWRAPEDEADALSCSVEGLIVIEPPGQQELPRFLGAIRQRLAGAAS